MSRTKKTTNSRKRKSGTPNFGASFRNAVKRGTPATTAVWNIARKHGKTETAIWNWLFNNGFVNRKKVGGSWVYWPNFEFNGKTNTGGFKPFSFQQFINWAIASGYCTPQQVNQLKTQKDFFNFFGPFFAQQFGWTVLSGWNATQVKNFGGGTTSNGRSTSKKRTATRKNKARKGTAKSKKRSGTKTRSRKRTTASAKKTRKGTTGRKRRTSTTSRKRTTKRGTTRNRRNTKQNRTKRSTRKTTVRSYKFPKANTGRRTYRKAA